MAASDHSDRPVSPTSTGPKLAAAPAPAPTVPPSGSSQPAATPSQSHTASTASQPQPASQSQTPQSQPSQSQLSQPQPSQPQPSSQANQQQVTVETETVPSVPMLGVLNPAVGANSSLRIKRSQDSVPRLASTKGSTKKRSQRMAQGSKADFFAAKVADAVDEQDSSGSDETFVYDTTQGPPGTTYGESLRRPYGHSASDLPFTGPPHPTSTAVASQAGHSSNGGPSNLTNGTLANGGNGQPANGGSGYVGDDYDSETAVADFSTGETDAPSLFRPPHLRNIVVPKRPVLDGTVNGGGHSNTNSNGHTNSHPANQSNGTSDGQPNGHSNIPNYNYANTYTSTHYGPSNYAPGLPYGRSHSVTGASMSDADYTDDNHWFLPNQSGPSLHPRPSPLHYPGPPAYRSHSRRTSRSRPDSSPHRDANDSIRAKHSYLQRWRAPAQASSQYDEPANSGAPNEEDERTSLLRGRPSLYNYHSSLSAHGRRWNSQMRVIPSPGHPNSDAISVPDYSPTESTSFGKFQAGVSMTTRVIVCTVLMLILVLSMLFVGGLVLAASRPLREFEVVSLSDVLVSDRELVFSIITRARNPGIFAKAVDRGELDVFATTTHAKHLLDPDHGTPDEPPVWTVFDSGKDDVKRTVLLGNISELESPMIFEGGFSSQIQWRTASAKLVSPLSNNTELWSDISAHEFDLTIKGVLCYNVLGNQHRETVSRAYHVVAPDFYDNIHDR